MRKLPARKLLGAIIATALFLPETAFTLGLGEIEVHSALNQKLSADIELLSTQPEEAEGIIVKLASRKEFNRAGLDRPYLLNDLHFKSEIKDGVPHISVSSGSPIREPFLNFLVEVDWPKGHMIREYTVLLDPPVFMTQAASPTVSNSAHTGFRTQGATNTGVTPVLAPAATTSPGYSSGSTVGRPALGKQGGVAEAPTEGQPQAVTNPAFIPAPVLQQQSSFNQPANRYRVQSGDTAWSLAKAMRPDPSISIEQMMIAMLRANPESFINENVNGLKRGYILRTPDYNQIVSISTREARALVIEQAALWRQYQQMKAGGQPASAMSTDEMPANGESTDSAVIDGEEDDAYLEIVSAGSGSSSLSGKDPTDMSAQELRAELALARERVETERVEKEALQEQISSLEQNVSKMKGMLSIEDSELSEVQALAAEGTDLETSVDDVLDDAVAESDEMADEMAATDINAGMSAEDEQAVDEINAEIAALDAASETMDEDAAVEEGAVEDDISEIDTEAVDEESAIFLDESSEQDDSAEGEAVEVETVEIDQAEVVVDEVEPVQPEVGRRAPADPLQQLLDDPILLAAAGGGLLLILAVIGLIIKKRRAADTETDTDIGTFEDDTKSVGNDDLESLADEIAAEADDGASVESVSEKSSKADDDDLDLEDTIVAEADTEESEDEGPRDDVIAEADVYLAYGIYQQAEELLTQAIADNPGRDDYRLKLAETHYASKNADAFIEVATEIRKRSEGDNTPEWKKVLVMGQDLCSDNAMFQGTMVGGLDVDAVSTSEPAMDFDLGIDGDKEEDETSSPDMSTDDEPLELPEMDSDTSDNEEADQPGAAAESAGEVEFDISDAGAVEEAAVEEDEFSLDIDASELDIDTQDEAGKDEVAFAEDEVHELDTGDGLDLDFGLDEVNAAESDGEAASEEVSLDLTDDAAVAGLDLSTDGDKDSAASDTSAALDDDEDFDLSSLDDVDEISTKLDLARAYLDMGDNEGTREILEEVLADGSDEQKQEANDLMSKLD